MNRKIDIIINKLESMKAGSNFLINKQDSDLLDQIASLIAINESSRLGLSDIKKLGNAALRGAYKTKK